MKHDLPYVNAYKDRHGRMRYYFRRKGYARRSLPHPDAPNFLDAYREASKPVARVEPSETFLPGTFKALCHEYEHSAEFGQLAKSTQRETRYVLNALVAKHGDNPINKFERRHIRIMRDSMKDKPGAANKMLRVLKVLLGFAVDRDYIADTPARRIKMLKGGEHRAWTAEEMEAFRARWPIGTLQHTSFAMALYTGQRRADLAGITWTSIAGDSFKLTQGKTGTVLVIPLHPELKKALAAVHPRAETILAKNGRALNPIYFGHLMAKAIEAAGLDEKCVLHGLRKSAAVALIDAGCTPHQVAAITGHKTQNMIELYSKMRNQEKLGKDAMRIWKRAKRS